MELHYLEIFNTVSALESYKKASDAMHISQPALSTEVKKLEGQIGLKLFDRVGNRIVLTENGRMLQRYTSQIFRIVDDMQSAITTAKVEVGGTLHIGASNTPGTYLLPKIMADFRRQYPAVRFTMSLGDTSEIVQLVNKGTLDMAVNGGSCRYGQQVCVEELLHDRLVFVASPENPLAGLAQVGPEDLKQVGFVVHKTGSQLSACYRDAAACLGIPENIVMSLGNIDAMKNAVKTGIGVALIPEISARSEIRKGSLVILPVLLPRLEYPYHLVYNRSRTMSLAAVRFCDYLRAYAEKQPKPPAQI
jgi:DNA-binding transcriptional LysR family regulator